MAAADIAFQQASGEVDALGVANAQVRAWLEARNVAATFFVDSETGAGQVFGAQGPTDLRNWPSDVHWYLYPEGSFLFLDGGTLDLGLVRDSTLNDTNDFQVFAETFEAVAFVGVESLAVTSTVCPNGESQIASDETGSVCAAS
ncbi:MAG TPA: major capsid protein [Acidimicrobiia bacterium]|nr:major capsid protein [Acidimicrobiia bacterium]